MDFHSLGLLLMRLGFSCTIALFHGLPKLLDFSNKMHSFPNPIGMGSTLSLSLALIAELICALLVAIGILTRLAAIPLVVAMGVAFFVFHAADPFMKKELAFLYFVAFSSILVAGPGKYSLDSVFRGVR